MAAHGLHRFDRIHGKGAFARLRSMLDDPAFAYQEIGDKFGLTRQYIAQLAKGLGVDSKRRRRKGERMRMLHREPRVIKVDYPPGIRAVIDKIRRSAIQVTPYVFPVQPSVQNRAWRSVKMVLVNGVLCTIQLRKGDTKSPNGREYARFDVNREVRESQSGALGNEKRSRNQGVRHSANLICETSRMYIFPLTVNMPWAAARNPAKTGLSMRRLGTCLAAQSTIFASWRVPME